MADLVLGGPDRLGQLEGLLGRAAEQVVGQPLGALGADARQLAQGADQPIDGPRGRRAAGGRGSASEARSGSRLGLRASRRGTGRRGRAGIACRRSSTCGRLLAGLGHRLVDGRGRPGPPAAPRRRRPASFGSIRTEISSSRPLTTALTAPPPAVPSTRSWPSCSVGLLHLLADLAGVAHQVGEVAQVSEHGRTPRGWVIDGGATGSEAFPRSDRAQSSASGSSSLGAGRSAAAGRLARARPRRGGAGPRSGSTSLRASGSSQHRLVGRRARLGGRGGPAAGGLAARTAADGPAEQPRQSCDSIRARSSGASQLVGHVIVRRPAPGRPRRRAGHGRRLEPAELGRQLQLLDPLGQRLPGPPDPLQVDRGRRASAGAAGLAAAGPAGSAEPDAGRRLGAAPAAVGRRRAGAVAGRSAASAAQRTFFLRRPSPARGPAPPASIAREPGDQLAQLGQVLQPGDPAEGQFDEQPAVRAAPEPAAGLGQDLLGGEDRVERPAVGDRLAAGRPAPAGPPAAGDVGPGGQRPSRRGGTRSPVEHVGRLHPVVDRLVEQRAGPGRVAVGQGVEQVEHPLVARRSRAAGGPARPSACVAARGEQLFQQRLRVPHRPGGPSGDDVQRLAVGLDPLALADARRAARRSRSGPMPAKSNRWQRERTVIGILFGSVVAKTNLTWLGRLLQRLQQGVEGAGREHVDLVDVVDLVPRPARPQPGVLPELADGLDAVVAGPVDLDDVDVLRRRRSPGRCRTRCRASRSARCTQFRRLGEDPGHRRLADAPGAAEQVRLGDPVQPDRVAQGLDDVVLADDVLEPLRAGSGGRRPCRRRRRAPTAGGRCRSPAAGSPARLGPCHGWRSVVPWVEASRSPIGRSGRSPASDVADSGRPLDPKGAGRAGEVLPGT